MNKSIAIMVTALLATCLAGYGKNTGPQVWTDFSGTGAFPLSFNYGGQPSSALLANVEPVVSVNRDGDVKVIEKKWHLDDGLVVTLNARCYQDYQAEEWLAWISNTGEKKSKLITDLYVIDEAFPVQAKNEVVIHANRGDDCSKRSFEPFDIVLNKGQREVFYPSFEDGSPCGKSTTGARGWPYWNIQNGGQGWILALGWPGTWQTEFSREDDSSFRVKAGQRTFNAALMPGETVRTPLFCILPWKARDAAAAQNIWRHFYLDHVIPRFGGEPEKPVTEIQCAMREESIAQAQRYIDAGIKPRITWCDAGWYPTLSGQWLETGDWVLDPKRYPNGIKPFSDWAHAHGIECLLWFEPERVRGDHALNRDHKDWLLYVNGWNTQTLNLGNPAALDWAINHFDRMIKDNGLDWYREDMNDRGPDKAWAQADTETGKDRLGITENLYVQGHLAYWDALKERNPGLHIDACASGGRRDDLETMHRAVPLLRSDYQWLKEFGPEYIDGNQCHTWALSAWFPFQGSAVYEYEPYKYRSFYLPSFGMGDMNEANRAAVIKAFNECKAIQPMMLYGDYWPMTPYSLEDDAWIAWQFNRKKEGDGCIQAFRRENCDTESLTVKLRGLNPHARYRVKDLDSSRAFILSGKQLMKNGLAITLPDKASAAIFVYEKVKRS